MSNEKDAISPKAYGILLILRPLRIKLKLIFDEY